MRLFVLFILAVFSAYSGWWFYGKHTRIIAIDNWLQTTDAQGWGAQGSYEINGFPNRYDVTFDNIILTNTNQGWVWQTPRLHLAQLSYRPNHFIAFWPAIQKLSTPKHSFDIHAQELRASLVLTAKRNLDRTVLEGRDITINAESGWSVHSDDLLLAMRHNATMPSEYHINLKSNEVRLGGRAVENLISNGQPLERFDDISADLAVLYENPIRYSRLRAGAANALGVNLRSARLTWAGIELRAKGEVLLDRQGYPTGQLTLQVREWAKMIDMAVDTGVFDADMGELIKSALGVAALLTNDANRLEIPLNFADRKIYLGPIVIGDAPSLKLG